MAELPDLSKTEVAIIEQTNSFRMAEQLLPLARNLALEEAAREFARYLAKSGRFAHEADGRQPADRALAAGYKFCLVAENLALNLDSRGFTSDRLSAEAMDGWKASPGHRKNLLLANATEIGVGVAQAPGPEPKFLSVQLFGRPASLSYDFRVTNRSHDNVTYTYADKSYTVEPRVTATHTGCDPGDVVFERSGSWAFGTRMNARYKVRSGATFVLRPGSDGRVFVEMQN